MAMLFEKTEINGMWLANRCVRSATWEGLADPHGFPTDSLTDVYTGLAKGGIGAIITGHAYVSAEGQAVRLQMSLSGDEYVPHYTKMTDAVHATGGVIVAQLAHAGSRAPSRLTGMPPLGPSAPSENDKTGWREMTADDIARTTAAFASAALRARRAGFDGIQLHAAHGYLLSQFLSPLWNKRQDDYGGPIENRARMLVETLREVRASVGPDFPVMAKINCEDFVDGGLTINEMLATSLMLQEAGMDAIEMSGGSFSSEPYTPSRMGKAAQTPDGAYYVAAARRFKEKIRIPLILVGGVRDHEVADRLVSEGITDYVAFCRPLIAEPDLIARWRSGDTAPAFCRSDNLCFKPAFEGRGVFCVARQRKAAREEKGG
jgi:2,4-dienoyl-CoA reductase-like NADH-dependent reductase (Old Yellow Enzyme family)